MAGIDHRNSGEAVKILATRFVPDRAPGSTFNGNGRNRLHEAGHHVVFVFLDSVRHNFVIS